ncbi:hypothetical protein GE061_019381 [Apolygus lucorum]|uniref:C2H2-type domain-containing protein n=1 Tax=Apolygus lucorum TaxID=248454 RepID=A0A8S9X9N0_APOLU|nr:hypothetical protein GE061_019381 [Apolygus lucorum]
MENDDDRENMAAVLAENYQLKWHSHGAHLHSSVAMLYRSDNFTDVTLVTSDGRTMSILLQYMYSGEATVSNDQLNGVLRAGELLRIKGLCHSGAKEKEKRYFSGAVSNHSETQSRAGSSNSGQISANYYQASHSAAPSRNKTPDASSCNPSSSTPKQTQKAPPVAEKPAESQGVPLEKPKEKRQVAKEKESSKDHLDVSSSGEGSEIVIEENMKIELLVKEEPIDWEDEEDMVNEDSEDPMATVKAERLSPRDCGENVYAPLTCDMCQETFNSPALWVRHIETHPVTDQPKKRKRQQGEDENDDEDEFQLLRCELCQKMYTSPADWVRHIQSSHTEEQLAVSNSTRKLRKSTLVSCPSCNKSFPSLASMLIHSRTHTGEKPYICCVCEKGFNVKSNLLRHLRTLHDHLMSPDNQYQSLLKDSS